MTKFFSFDLTSLHQYDIQCNCHITLHWAAPPISFYSNQCLLLRAFRRIIFPPRELKNRSNQILLLLLLRHSVLKHDYAFCNAEKPKTLNCIAFSCIFSRMKCLNISPSCSKTLNKWCRSTIYSTTAISCTSFTC